MSQEQFEQTVTQEHKEQDEYPHFMTLEWNKQFEKNHEELRKVMEDLKCKA